MAKRDDEVVIGLGGSNHDGSAALLRGNSIEVAVEQERLSRRKHGVSWWWENPVGQAVDYCLDAAAVTLDQVSHFVSSDLLPRRVSLAYRDIPIHFFPHHLCHAASACMMLPPRTRAAILVYDGMGSIRNISDDRISNMRETFGFFYFDRDGLHVLGHTLGDSLREHDDYPSGCSNSIGKVFDLVTTLLGFDESDSGKTMGLAAHGQPRYAGLIAEYVTLGDSFSDVLRYDADDPALPTQLSRILSDSPGFGTKADVAASVQTVLETVLLHASGLLAECDHDVLCIAGGCALNSLANGRLAAKLPPGRKLLVPPHAGDAGLALGALWLDRFKQLGRIPELTLRGQALQPAIARPGRVYGPDRCHIAARRFYPDLAYDPAVCTPGVLATRLAAGEIVGLFNGPSEIGPRALGGRSILADPRRAQTREYINRVLKRREPFRPFAPMILAERCSEYFDEARQTDPYMLRVASATFHCRERAPAVVHVDGTARVQTVDLDGDPFLRALLLAFDELVGVPLLLNTSFNRRGEPIVETPEDALDAFLGMQLDGLYLDGLYFNHPKSAAIR